MSAIWLVTYKKHVSDKYVSVSEVLEELLCFGWMDGVKRKVDADRTLQLIALRRAQHWAKTYKDRAAWLNGEGGMHESGLRSVEIFKEKGLWDFMDDVYAIIKPADLVEALNQYPDALANFNALAPSSQRFVLRWIKLDKTDKTYKKRISETARLAAKNEKIPGS